jgi:hypothetical protein
MRIALIAPPFIAVPPKDYGGTELFIAQLAEGLQKTGANVVVYANGESTVNVERRWRYEHSQWPIRGQDDALLKDMDHTSWAVQDAAQTCDVIHMQTAQGLTCSRFVSVPVVYTIHHPHGSEQIKGQEASDRQDKPVAEKQKEVPTVEWYRRNSATFMLAIPMFIMSP